MSLAPLLKVEGLSVTYHGATRPSLRDVSLQLQEKQRLAIIGESGSGKSTLARTIAGILPRGARTEGQIVWNGDREKSSNPQFPTRGRDIAYVFQDPSASLNPVLTIGEQVAEAAIRHLRLTRKQAYTHARDLLAEVQLPNPDALLSAYPHQISGGQRQRVAIAAAISAAPKILIADEATSALDTITQAAIARLLDHLVNANGMTLIFITHDIALASSLADEIAVFQSGQLVESGKARDVLSHPTSDDTKRLLSSHLDLTTPPLIRRAS
ncbi:ABC transporter ATP-binding protein [Agrobacterium sp. SORGH_AS 787]|uniref:ABC transporter ATP-binding protein n=1 Tax=Agrobacterium sp. SORGH_AS 787 TaxID=3041775 RepID=UPI0027824C00|nr:peptide/nickel transport system ATP-binding protein [Rhizobium sp. SORGH_AS_0787]